VINDVWIRTEQPIVLKEDNIWNHKCSFKDTDVFFAHIYFYCRAGTFFSLLLGRDFATLS